MSDAHPIHAQLAAWRACGADRYDPVAFGLLEGLARRVPAYHGAARATLELRLAALAGTYGRIVAHADDAKRNEAQRRPAIPDRDLGEVPVRADTDTPAPRTLGGLVDYIGRQGDALGLPDRAARPGGSWPEHEAVDYMHKVWKTLSTGRQLRQSLEQVPSNAGPLNSSSLIHRALALMQDLAPGYLQHFLDYAETLAWMERLRGEAFPDPAALRAANRKGSRAKTAR